MRGAKLIDPRYIAARQVLLDALEALGDQRAALILVGAQAVYVHAGELDDIAIAAFTEDADLALDPAILLPDPRLLDVLRTGGFARRLDQQGVWEKQGTTTTVDFLVPETLAGAGSRSADLGPLGTHIARRARGLEAVLVDNERRELVSFDPAGTRAFELAVAGPAALLVAKLFKMKERLEELEKGKRARQKPKDALDYLRLLHAVRTEDLLQRFRYLGRDERSRGVAQAAMEYAHDLFAQPSASGSRLIAQAVAGVADEDFVVAVAVALTDDLWQAYNAAPGS